MSIGHTSPRQEKPSVRNLLDSINVLGGLGPGCWGLAMLSSGRFDFSLFFVFFFGHTCQQTRLEHPVRDMLHTFQPPTNRDF